MPMEHVAAKIPSLDFTGRCLCRNITRDLVRGDRYKNMNTATQVNPEDCVLQPIRSVYSSRGQLKPKNHQTCQGSPGSTEDEMPLSGCVRCFLLDPRGFPLR